MTTAFPTAIDNFTNPTATDALDSVTVPHASQHANVNDAVEAIETAIGTTAAPVLAKLASPTFTGVPAAPTAAVNTDTTQVATTAFVQASRTYFGLTTGLYYSGLRTATATSATTFQTVYFTPISFVRTETFDRILMTTGSSYVGTGVVRLGIYDNDDTTGKPSTVVLDAGTVSVSGTNTAYEITISQSLAAGNYWLAFVEQTAPTSGNYTFTSNLLSIGYAVSTTGLTVNAGYWRQAGVAGAFATAGTLTSANSNVAVALRAS